VDNSSSAVAEPEHAVVTIFDAFPFPEEEEYELERPLFGGEIREDFLSPLPLPPWSRRLLVEDAVMDLGGTGTGAGGWEARRRGW
jgi:hypothetical protein